MNVPGNKTHSCEPLTLIQMSCADLATMIFANRNAAFSVDFYAEYKPESDEKSWAYQAITANFADSINVLINYYGGGSLLAYELTDDVDASGLQSALEQYFFTAELGDSVWVEIPTEIEPDDVSAVNDERNEPVTAHWIEDTPFSCCCSVCGTARCGGANDPNEDRCPNCHAVMVKE